MQNIKHLAQQFDDDESDTYSDDRRQLRISTAPAKPITDLEEFKQSSEFMLLEQAFICQGHLIQKDFQKYDLDNPDGQRICKKYLNQLEKLSEAYQVKVTSRSYRNDFSKAYNILYEKDKLCYLTEILDSAQEGRIEIKQFIIGFPYLWVNGEKYTFTPQVLDAGAKLIEQFFRVQHILRHAYSRACQETPDFSTDILKQEVSSVLEEFDNIWVRFEKSYVKELMNIEANARRFISKAIELEKQLSLIETRERMKGKILVTGDEYIKCKQEFCKILSQINQVANMDGKGRDDLNADILIEAEGISRRITKEQSRAVRNLAESIKKNFQKIRDLFRKYNDNIEMVDPQLKNNVDLVDLLQDYENQWEKGMNYLMVPKKCTQLIYFSHIIETTAEKYQQFQEQIEYRDAEIFVNIPSLMVLKNLENEDKNICSYFLPSLNEPNSKYFNSYKLLKEEFTEWRKLHSLYYEYYNILEKMLLGVSLDSKEQQAAQSFGSKLDTMIQKIKELSIELQRFNAAEWNSFIDAAINNS